MCMEIMRASHLKRKVQTSPSKSRQSDKEHVYTNHHPIIAVTLQERAYTNGWDLVLDTIYIGYAEGFMFWETGVSLWLVPAANQALKLKRVMQIKSATAKSPSAFVDFEPHVTLATIPASRNVLELQTAIPPGQAVVPVRFKSVDVGEKYFMSVYTAVHDRGALAALRTYLREKLGDAAVPPIPHLSLYYIDDADGEERARVAEELKDSGRVMSRAEGAVALNCSEEPSGDPDVLGGFDGEAIWVVSCEGPVPEWEVLQKIPLAIPV